ncbi:hypothetical protein CYMTET_12745 [Cymbomonas tetramitiformis]|uniref:Uncharacterized protein n=1 Tax=Cymbomonas tetramitiformis TaxID=36881 RepID=A0AAE0GL23_9CHLO|nr:hypothetical protein CYMTET_12745 [Cymbomonas tetramitiformis]
MGCGASSQSTGTQPLPQSKAAKAGGAVRTVELSAEAERNLRKLEGAHVEPQPRISSSSEYVGSGGSTPKGAWT